jgi:hypothetical protein
MNRWDDGRKPIKKLPHWAIAIILLVYVIALITMIIPFFCDFLGNIDQKIEIARRPESARYDAKY